MLGGGGKGGADLGGKGTETKDSRANDGSQEEEGGKNQNCLAHSASLIFGTNIPSHEGGKAMNLQIQDGQIVSNHRNKALVQAIKGKLC